MDQLNAPRYPSLRAFSVACTTGHKAPRSFRAGQWYRTDRLTCKPSTTEQTSSPISLPTAIAALQANYR